MKGVIEATRSVSQSTCLVKKQGLSDQLFSSKRKLGLYSSELLPGSPTNMALTLLFACCLVLACAADVTTEENSDDVIVNFEPYEEAWVAYKEKFDRQYDEKEDAKRYKVFLENVKMIEAHNKDFLANKTSFTMGTSLFTDQTDEDREGHSCHVDEDEEPGQLDWTGRHKRQTGFCTSFSSPRGFVPPKSLDWRSKGAVASVKDQGKCGSCYAFGVTATIEAQLKFATGKLIDLSEQQLVDCHRGDCKGSNAAAALEYVYSAGGVMSSADYPYRPETAKNGQAGQCSFNKNKVQTSVSGCLSSLNDENRLKTMVASHGPAYVSVAVLDSFRQYKDGVYSVSSCSERSPGYQGRHCLTVVGYGHDTRSGKDYWIVKNSWGRSWANKGGYAWIERGKNVCGIGSKVTVPVITADMSSSGEAVSATTFCYLLSFLAAVSVSRP